MAGRGIATVRLASGAVSIVAVLLAFAVGGVMMVVLGVSPLDGYSAMVRGAFGDADAFATTAARATPLLLVGAGICIAFRARVINIGGEGQIIAGALASTVTALALPDLPRAVLVPLVLLAGCVGGGVWGGVPGALKGYLGVNEILSTIMLNIVAVQLMNFLLRSALIDPAEVERGTRIPQTERLSPNADLPILLGGSRLHLGVVIALVAAVVAWALLWRTSLGYRLRAVGAGPDAARYAGMPVGRMTTLALALSGALCGLAGAVLVFGSEGNGVSSELMRASTPLAIPMSARVESLNVASSAAILLARRFALR
jgi:simple sugar transport system permease protein